MVTLLSATFGMVLLGFLVHIGRTVAGPDRATEATDPREIAYLTELRSVPSVSSSNTDESLTSLGDTICDKAGTPGVTREMIEDRIASSGESSVTARAYVDAASRHLCPDKSFAEPVTAPYTGFETIEAPGATVKRVIDGDTFELSDGARIRVLGIDSCEMSTPGGKEALKEAEYYLMGQDVLLTQEPGVDLDSRERHLRYVQARGLDFGRTMVMSDHTGVYTGKNDANPDYVAMLRQFDGIGRDCSGPPPPAPVTASDDNHYVPVPSNEDDDDHHKSRFCRRHWYC